MMHRALAFSLLLSLWLAAAALAQSTPIPVVLPTGTPTPLPPTDLPTRTATSLGPPYLTALAGTSNIRSAPDLENATNIIGQIEGVQTFQITGKYFEWFQIAYPQTASGVGWVHNTVVQVFGDLNLIPDLTLTGTAGPPAAIVGPGGAAATPEGFISQDLPPGAQAGPVAGPPLPGAEGALPPGAVSVGRLPTYTLVPITATPINLAEVGSRPEVIVGGGLPPIAIISGLIGLGGLGMLFSLLRR